MRKLRWRKSSHSGGGNQECVEVALDSDEVLVRDSKDVDGGFVTLPDESWSALLHKLGRL